MNLIVWQKAIEIFQLVCKITFEETKIDFKLRSQIADAAQSISANIAEGYGRRSINEYIQYLYTALGSAAETLTRAIGLQQTKQISESRFHDSNLLHYEMENRLLRLVEKLELKHEDADWIARIAEDPEEYSATPVLQYSNTPSLPIHA